MRIRPPSLGFGYLLLTVAAVPWFLDYINRPFFFEHPWGSRERDVGEARYLLGIAKGSDTDKRDQWLRRALELALKRSELELADQVFAELERSGVSAEGAGLREIMPGTIWAFGLDAEGWTAGNKLATFILRNPTPAPQQVALHFTTTGDGKARHLIGGDPVWFSLTGDGTSKAGSVTTPKVAPGSSLAISVGASHPVMVEGKSRGLKFERVELIQ
ncbi:MAG: hypothetical protein KDC98_10540 [Planctomycetes bacterium]|nr:hypothetical protein [Planctomycetota bacterium]